MTKRWGDDAPADTDAARERLIDAAEACIDRYGLSKTTVEDVARRAHVSRATIYRYFDNRDELMLAVVLRSLEHSGDGGLDDVFDGADTPERFGQALVESTVRILDQLRHDPRLSVLLNRDTAGVSATITGASEALFAYVLDGWRPRLTAALADGLLRPGLNVDEVSEWVLRGILSLLTVEGPHHHSPEDERRLVATFLVPALVPAPPPNGPGVVIDLAGSGHP